MQKGRQLPLPPLIEAIADVDELEEMAEEFERRDGYAPELLPHCFSHSVQATVLHAYQHHRSFGGSLLAGEQSSSTHFC